MAASGEPLRRQKQGGESSPPLKTPPWPFDQLTGYSRKPRPFLMQSSRSSKAARRKTSLSATGFALGLGKSAQAKDWGRSAFSQSAEKQFWSRCGEQQSAKIRLPASLGERLGGHERGDYQGEAFKCVQANQTEIRNYICVDRKVVLLHSNLIGIKLKSDI